MSEMQIVSGFDQASTKKVREFFSPEEDAIIRKHYPAGGARACADFLPSRHVATIGQRARVLKLSAPDPSLAWSAEAVAILKKRWADGLSDAQIAIEINAACSTSFSRASCIGKRHRLGLSGRVATGPVRTKSVAPAVARPERKARPERRVSQARAPAAFHLTHPAPPAVAPVIENDIPLGQRRSLLQLTNATCRWPVGDPGAPGFFFCGGEADLDGRRPYCAYHAGVALVPPAGRRSP